MKTLRLLFPVSIILISIFIFSCTGTNSDIPNSQKTESQEEQPGTQNEDSIEKDEENPNQNEESVEDENSVLPKDSKIENKISQYFWGIWQRMDNGQFYIIDETTVSQGNTKYNFVSSDDTNLTVTSLGNFSKQSDSVMLNGAIPYFRKGGTNLEYKMKLVGFEDTISRAASSLSGFKAKGKSKKYTSFSSTADSENDGTITLNAPVAGDVQTVTITSGDSTVATVSNLTIENNGNYMGTIPISREGQYSLKVTGTIPDSEKDDGYLYGNNCKSYNMTLTITNVSDVTSAPSVCAITPADSCVSITSIDGSNINDGVIISTLKPKFTKIIKLSVKCGTINDGFIDTGLIITIKNAATEQTWQDFVPLRFFQGLVPITIAAESTETIPDAALNGFIIYPDANSQFFSVPDKSCKTIYVPTFGKDSPFSIAFSGATIEGEMSNSTEMLYTVAVGTWNKKNIERSSTAFISAVQYGEEGSGNSSENTAINTESEFEAYLTDGDIDFYKFVLTGDMTVSPTMQENYTISFANMFGDAPSDISVPIGTCLTDSILPIPEMYGYVFDGWYLDDKKVEGYVVTEDLLLFDNWKYKTYSAEELNSLDMSKIPNKEYTIKVTGAIVQNTINILVDKIQHAKNSINLDLTDTTGITTFECDYYDSIFKSCEKLKTIRLPNSVEILGGYSFAFCKSLESIVMPQNLKEIGQYCFYNCENLKSIILPKTVTNIDMYAFSGCSNLVSVQLSDSISELSQYIFNECTSLKDITIPESVTTIGYYAFHGCSSLESIIIPKKVTIISSNAFSDCPSLQKVAFDDNLNWYYYYQNNSANKMYINISDDLSANAINLRSTYTNVFWYKD